MTCNHTNLSLPVTVSLCLDTGDYNCCPDEFETMVVCKDCGYYKITSVQEVCADCCNKDTTIWDDYLNTWHAPDGSEGWSGTNLGFNLTNYSVYQNALNSSDAISSCEFMVKGYHYTKPTDPSRTDSARLYIDTNINGEESSTTTGKYSWIKYKISGSVSQDSTVNFEGFLPANFWTSSNYIYPKDLNGNNTTTIYFVVFSNHTLTTLYVPGNMVAPGGRAWSDINITGPGTYSYTDPTFGTKYKFTLTEVDFGNKWIAPTTGTLSDGFFKSYTSEANAISLTTWETANNNAMLNVTGTNISSFTAKNWPITLGDLKNNYSYSNNSTAATALSALMGNKPGIYYYWDEQNAGVATYRANASDLGYVTYTCSEPYLLHLKGFHNFYANIGEGVLRTEEVSWPNQIGGFTRLLEYIPLISSTINISWGTGESESHTFLVGQAESFDIESLTGTGIGYVVNYDGYRQITVSGPTQHPVITFTIEYYSI